MPGVFLKYGNFLPLANLRYLLIFLLFLILITLQHFRLFVKNYLYS